MAKQKPPKQKREAKTQIGEAESRVVQPTNHKPTNHKPFVVVVGCTPQPTLIAHMEFTRGTLATGAAVGASAAATAAAGAACAASAAAIVAAIAACAAAAADCSRSCRCCVELPGFPGRSPERLRALLTAQPVAEEVAVPVTPRTLATINTDEELLPRDRAACHALHAIAEASEHLITAGITARIGWDTVLVRPAGALPLWDLGGHRFATSNAVGVVSIAGVVAVPLAVPSNALLGAGFALTQGVSLLWGSKGEVARALAQEDFLRKYGLRREELKWSLVPVSILYWDLAAGDGLLELCLKAKRGALGVGDLGDTRDTVVQLKLRKLLCRLLDCMPGSPSAKAKRLDQAIRKAAADMSAALPPVEEAAFADISANEKGARLEAAFRLAAADCGHPAVSRTLEQINQSARLMV